MNPKYRFFLYLNTDDVNTTEVYPVYKDDVAKEVEQENNQKFYRNKFSGKLAFITKDFDFIVSKPFDTEFNLIIERTDDWGQTWVREFLGRFFITDCTVNYDNKKITFQPETVDDYTTVLTGLEKEFNLIPLAPEIQPIVLQKRPLIQVYVLGQSVVSCFLSGSFWEQDCNETTDRAALIQTYHFALCNILKEILITANGSEPVGGLYTGKMVESVVSGDTIFSGSLYSDTNLDYRIYVQIQYNPPWFGLVVCQIIRVVDNVVVYQFSKIMSVGENWDNEDFTMNGLNGATGTANAEMATYNVYARYFLDVEELAGLTTYDIPNDDIVDYNRNYRRVIGYGINIAYLSRRYSDDPTEWGRADNLKYYLPPYSIIDQKFYPIARSTWRYASLWFAFDVFDNILEEKGRKDYMLRDTFPIHSVIQRLLQEIAPGILHEPTTAYSQFLYSELNPISFDSFKLFVTQKTNVLFGNYQQPAQKAMTTLQQFTNMLRDTFKCYWHLEGNKFRIEHVSWYERGGSYNTMPIVGLDLTKMLNIRNGKNWAFSTSEITFDKVDMPERYQFAWSDDVTEVFEGFPIEIKSKYVQKGKIENINVSGFNSDVDMMLLAPDMMSQDGFAIFAAVPANAIVERPEYGSLTTSGTDALTSPTFGIKQSLVGKVGFLNLSTTLSFGASYKIVFYDKDNDVVSEQWNISTAGTRRLQVTIVEGTTRIGLRAAGTVNATFFNLEVPNEYELPYIRRTIENVTYDMQNGYLAFIDLQPKYFVYDLPARYVEINKQTAFALSIMKKRKQNVNFPVDVTPDAMKLIKTNIGNGQIDKMSINLHSRMTKTTLRYDTE